MKVTARKIITWLLYLLGIAPFFYIISILTFYFHARSILGRFPSYNRPDPKELSVYDGYNSIIPPAFGIWAICFLIWIALSVLLLVIATDKASFRAIAVSSIGHIIAIFITLGPIFEWFVD